MSNTRLPAWNLKQLMENYLEDFDPSSDLYTKVQLSKQYQEDFILLFFDIISKRRLTPLEEVVAVKFFPKF